MLSSGEDQVGYVDVEKVNVALLEEPVILLRLLNRTGEVWGGMYQLTEGGPCKNVA